MTESNTTTEEAQSKILQLFGLYKAEWHDGQLFEHFTEPEYFRELASRRPCVLIGGRGTGKTTVLRGLSFEGQYQMAGSQGRPLEHVPYIGLYYRVNTNRVTAFKGPELPEHDWIRYFSHYINLTFCGLLVGFLAWYERQTTAQLVIPQDRLRQISRALHLSQCSNLSDLTQAIKDSSVEFEASINNIGSSSRPLLSLLGAPIDELVSTVLALSEFRERQVFFLLDEYENFANYQQQVVNTVIKQASGSYVFKVGVRELGWRERPTLNPNEQLTHPADYARIHLRDELTGERFRRFADRVCNSRLVPIRQAHPEVTSSVEEALPGLSVEQEAALLGAKSVAQEIVRELESDSDGGLLAFARSCSSAQLFFVHFWAKTSNEAVRDLLADWKSTPHKWEERFGNYMHAALFTIRSGKAGIRKYYAGWNTFVKLADGNIRYLLLLIHESYANHFREGEAVNTPISPRHQTYAAQFVGKGNFEELEGLSVEGARLKKLLLGLGRIFGVLAERPEGHTPEVTQFQLVDGTDAPPSLEKASRAVKLLELSVMHQALVRFGGTKLVDETETRDYDYMIHPIFTAFFGFSYRRKRKLKLSIDDFLGLVERHKLAIRGILDAQNRAEEVSLPDQLSLFEAYFDASSD
jgi:hypothetical protein